jgi:hypothetical protein
VMTEVDTAIVCGVVEVEREGVGCPVLVAAGTFRVSAVGGVAAVELGAGSRVPGVTITAWAVRAVLFADVSISW